MLLSGKVRSLMSGFWRFCTFPSIWNYTLHPKLLYFRFYVFLFSEDPNWIFPCTTGEKENLPLQFWSGDDKYLLLQPQGTFPYPIRVLVKVPYGVRSWQWEKCSSTFVTQEPFWSMCLGIVVLQCFSSSFSTLNSISLPVKWLEQIFICLVARGCLLGCWFLLLSSSYFTVLQRDLLVFRSIYFSFSLQGMYGMFQPALLREKSQCGTESCSTECVHLQCWFSSQPAMGTISRFSLHFGGGVPKICPANVRYRVYVLS